MFGIVVYRWVCISSGTVGAKSSLGHEEMGTLCDVYHTLSPDFCQRKTTYILQTWRDLTSEVANINILLFIISTNFGYYTVRFNGDKDTIEVKPSFLNPYTDKRVHFCYLPKPSG